MAQLPAAVVIKTGRAPVGDFGKFTFRCTQFRAEVNVSLAANQTINEKIRT